MKKIEERTGGVWTPSPGSVYPTLSQLVDEGLALQLPAEGGRSDYGLTEEGRRYAEENSERLEQVWRQEEDETEGARELREAERELGRVLRRLRHHGTSEQIAEATRKTAGLARSLGERGLLE